MGATREKGVGYDLPYIHKKCGKKKLINYTGFVYCDHCEQIVDSEDEALTDEEYKEYKQKTEGKK